MTGIGAVFVRANDPERLGHWYAERLGVGAVPGPTETTGTRPPGVTLSPEAGPSRAHLPTPGPADGGSVTFRVDDLDALLTRLTEDGVDVHLDAGAAEGRVATLHDPEGNLITLWEPAGPPYASAPDLAREEEREARQGTRSRWRALVSWLPLLVVIIVGVAVVVVLGPGEESRSRSSLTPAPAATPSRGGSPATEQPVVVRELGHPLFHASGGWELFVRGADELVRIQPARGRITRTTLPPLASSGPVSLVVGRRQVLLRPLDDVPAVLVPDGEPGREPPPELDHAGPAFPGPRQGTVWMSGDAAGDLLPMSLYTLDGDRTGKRLPSGPADFWPVSSDGRGYVLGSGTGGTYVARPGGLHRVTTGAVLAVGPTHFLTKECDDRGRCATEVVDRETGARRELPGRFPEDSGQIGVISPDGSTAAMLYRDNRGGVTFLDVLELDTGVRHTLDLPVDMAAGNQQLAWSPDSRWLFAPSGGRLMAVEAGTWRAERVPVGTSTVNQVAVRVTS